MELAFLAAIVSAFTFVWLVIHCIAEYRWPQSPSPQTNNAYRESSSSAYSFGVDAAETAD
jgi:ABC-type branched-subunit amino acid transport system permease subunit